MRMRHFLAFAFMSCLLAACATTPRVSNSWRANDYAGPALTKLLVVGVGVDGASRRSFEDTLVQQLQANGVDARASYALGVEATTERAALERAAREAGMQAVVETRVLRSGYTTPAHDGPVFMPGFGFGSRGSYAGASVIFGGPGRQEVGATVESSLYSVPGSRMLWSLTSEDYYASDPQRSNAGLAALIVKRLREQGLI